MKEPVRVAVTGAAGQIGYALLFRIAAGEMLGKDQPVVLQLLEIPAAMRALEGVVMELHDAAFAWLSGVVASDKPEEAFAGAEYALLVGARPRGPGMERKDLLTANAAIFSEQGRALNERASRQVKVLVVGNPANTNALIALKSAPDLSDRQFSAMTRLDHNRALSQLSQRAGVGVREIRRMIVWGNHSTTQVPDLSHATVAGGPAADIADETWTREVFMPTVQQRGAAIIDARGASSAASAAAAAIDHMRDWAGGTAEGDWTSMGIFSDGSYGIEPGIIYSYPVTTRGGRVEIVSDLQCSPFIRDRMRDSERELKEEREAVRHLLG